MTLRLLPPVKPLETVQAIARSGSSGLARQAQAELKARTTAALKAVVRP